MHPEAYWLAILQNPQDDRPRLHYARWLNEHNNPLGEFIEVQCRLADSSTPEAQVLALENRERSLLAEHEDEWVGNLAGMVNWWVFRRGFVHEIALSTAQFLEFAGSLFRLAPVQEVHLERVRDKLDSLTTSSFLERPRYLDLSNNHLRDQGARRLAACPHLAHIQGLNLSSSAIGDAGVTALAHSPYLRNLRELYLCDNPIGRSGLLALARSRLAAQLQTLSLRFNASDAESATLLQRQLGDRVVL